MNMNTCCRASLLIAVAAAAVLGIGAIFTRELLVGPSRVAGPVDHPAPAPVRAAEFAAESAPEHAPATQMKEPTPEPKARKVQVK